MPHDGNLQDHREPYRVPPTALTLPSTVTSYTCTPHAPVTYVLNNDSPYSPSTDNSPMPSRDAPRVTYVLMVHVPLNASPFLTGLGTSYLCTPTVHSP